MVLIADIVTSWFYFSVSIFVLGVIVSRWTLFSRINEDVVGLSGFVDKVVLELVIKGLSLLMLSMLLLFLQQLIAFRDVFIPWRDDAWLLLRHTSWGSLWVSTLTVNGLALLTLYIRGISGWMFATACVFLGSMFPAFSGHASAVSNLSWLSLSSDVLHVWSAGGWLGSLTCLLVVERLWKKQNSEARSLLPMFIQKFSSLSMVWVAIIVVSGVVSASIHLSGIGDLFASGYGRILLLKMILAMMVIGLGSLNWNTIREGVHVGVKLGRLKRRSFKEAWLAQIVLLVTAVLIRGAPPGHQTAEHELNIEMFLVRMVGVGMFFYVTFFFLILLFAIYLLKRK